MNKSTVLVVDDDPNVVSLLRRILLLEGFQAEICSDGRSALARAAVEPSDLIILDWMLPDLDGLEVCKKLRLISQAPILMLTARDAIHDRVAGLSAGADDYLVKPFAFEELVARVKALMRRVKPETTEELSFLDLTMNLATRQVERGGQRIQLTGREHDLLVFFLEHPRRVLSREVIYESIWGFSYLGDSNSLEVHIGSLRRKLSPNGDPILIHTVRGV